MQNIKRERRTPFMNMDATMYFMLQPKWGAGLMQAADLRSGAPVVSCTAPPSHSTPVHSAHVADRLHIYKMHCQEEVLTENGEDCEYGYDVTVLLHMVRWVGQGRAPSPERRDYC